MTVTPLAFRVTVELSEGPQAGGADSALFEVRGSLLPEKSRTLLENRPATRPKPRPPAIPVGIAADKFATEAEAALWNHSAPTRRASSSRSHVIRLANSVKGALSSKFW